MVTTINNYRRNIGLLAIIMFLSILVVVSFNSYMKNLKIAEGNVVNLGDLKIHKDVDGNVIKVYGDIKLENPSKNFYCILFDTTKNNYIRLKTKVNENNDSTYSYETIIKTDKLSSEGNYMMCFNVNDNGSDTIIKTGYIVYSQGEIVEEK